MHNYLHLLAIAAAASTTVAVPTDKAESFRSPRIAIGRRDCSSKFGEKNTKTYGDYTGCSSSFSDGQGTYVRTDDVAYYGTINRDKCWTDLFYVSEEPHQAAWTNIGGDIDCANTSECTTSQEKGTEACTSTTFGTSAGLDFGIIKDVLGVSAGVSAEWTDSVCNTSTLTSSCTWDDQECHSLWASSYETLIRGYVRRRCNFHDDQAGDVTVWSMDYDIYVPTGKSAAGCAALCGDASYPDPLP